MKRSAPVHSQRLSRDGAPHRVRRVRVPVEQRVHLRGSPEGIEDLLGRRGDRERHEPAGEKLGVARHVGGASVAQELPRPLGSEPPDPGEYLVENNGKAPLFARQDEDALEEGINEVHAPRAV